MENYQCHVWIDNKTSELLVLKERSCSWGEFREGPLPEIPRMSTSGEKAWSASGRENLPGGVEGSVTYQIGSEEAHKMRVSFDVPARPFSSNSIEVEVPAEFAYSIKGWDDGGSTGSCTILLSRKQP